MALVTIMVSHFVPLPENDSSKRYELWSHYSCESRTKGGSTDGLAKAIFRDEAFATETVTTLARTAGCSAIALVCRLDQGCESTQNMGNHN